MRELGNDGVSRLVTSLVLLTVTVVTCVAAVVAHTVRVDMLGLESLSGELRPERHALIRCSNFRSMWQLADSFSFLALCAHLLLVPAAYVPVKGAPDSENPRPPQQQQQQPAHREGRGAVRVAGGWLVRRLGVVLDVFFLKLPWEMEWGALQWLHIALYVAHLVVGDLVVTGYDISLFVCWFVVRVLRAARQSVLSRSFRDPNATQAFVRAWVVRAMAVVGLDLVVLLATLRSVLPLSAIEEHIELTEVVAQGTSEDYEHLLAHLNGLTVPPMFLMWQLTTIVVTLYALETSGVVTPGDIANLRFGAKGAVVVVVNILSATIIGCMFALSASPYRLSNAYSQLTLGSWLAGIVLILWAVMAVVITWEVILLAFKRLVGFTVADTPHYDCFLTHDWGIDENGMSNHERVRDVCLGLQRHGVKPWFDEHHLDKAIVQEMCDGIDNSTCVVVFITARYVDKVSMTKTEANPNPNPDDNCRREFNYAVQRKTSHGLVPVVMERRMRDTRLWRGAVGMSLAQGLYVDMARGSEPQANDEFEEQVKALAERVKAFARSGKDVEMGGMPN